MRVESGFLDNANVLRHMSHRTCVKELDLYLNTNRNPMKVCKKNRGFSF
jgi:hypothetical protein